MDQGPSNLDLEIHFPAEFSTNPDQTHLSMLTNTIKNDTSLSIRTTRNVYSILEYIPIYTTYKQGYFINPVGIK